MTELFEGITLWQKPLHSQVSLYGDLERGGKGSEDLKINQGGTVNHSHGFDMDAVRQVLAGIEGTGFPEHAGRMDEVVEYVTDRCAAERREGHCFGEVLSSNYRFLSRFYRTMTLRDTLRLLERLPRHEGLLRLAGELRTWIQVDRFIDRLFQVADGIVHAYAIRCKKDPASNESCSLAAHCHEREVTDRFIADQIRKLSSPSAETLKNRPHEVIAYRLYMSEVGREIEAATRLRVQGRLATRVGVERPVRDGLHAIMPVILNIPESPGLPPQVVWEVEVDGHGRVVERVASNHLNVPADREFLVRARRGEPMPHPLGRKIPDGWLILGPDTPMPDAPLWTGDARPVEPPPPEEPEPPALRAAGVTWELLEPHIKLAAAVVGDALDLDASWEDPRLRVAADRFRSEAKGASRQPVRPSALRRHRLAAVALVTAAMVVVDEGRTEDPNLLAAVAALRSEIDRERRSGP